MHNDARSVQWHDTKAYDGPVITIQGLRIYGCAPPGEPKEGAEPKAPPVAPNSGALVAPNAGVLAAPNAGVLAAPKAGVLPPPNGDEAPNAGVLGAPNAGDEDAPKALVPNAGCETHRLRQGWAVQRQLAARQKKSSVARRCVL